MTGLIHDVDSSEVAFKIAASQALQAASKKADMALIRTNYESRSYNSG